MATIARQISQFSKREIDTAFEHARCAHKAPGITILSAPAQRPIGRILVIASRKVGKAVIRNRLKRRLKAIFYEEKMYEQPYDLICVLYPEIASYDFQALKKLLVSATPPCKSV